MGVEDLAVHGLIDHPRCGQVIAKQSCDEGLCRQCPNGAVAFKGAPRRARPRRRVIFVVVPVSSRKTRRWTYWPMRG